MQRVSSVNAVSAHAKQQGRLCCPVHAPLLCLQYWCRAAGKGSTFAGAGQKLGGSSTSNSAEGAGTDMRARLAAAAEARLNALQGST